MYQDMFSLKDAETLKIKLIVEIRSESILYHHYESEDWHIVINYWKYCSDNVNAAEDSLFVLVADTFLLDWCTEHLPHKYLIIWSFCT